MHIYKRQVMSVQSHIDMGGPTGLDLVNAGLVNAIDREIKAHITEGSLDGVGAWSRLWRTAAGVRSAQRGWQSCSDRWVVWRILRADILTRPTRSIRP